MYRIGIDLGGTKTEIAVFQKDPSHVLFRKRLPTEQNKGYEHILEVMAILFAEAKSFCQYDFTVGVAIPGSISPQSSKVRNANLQALNGRTLKLDLEKKIGCPVWMANDANCLALSEATFGAGKGYDLVIGLILGTGMGGGVVFNGKVINGFTGVAAEFGHTSLDRYGKKCWCGNFGCIELHLSGTAFEDMDEELGTKSLGTGRRKGFEIYQSFLNKETRAVLSVQKYLEFFGQALANFSAAYDPDVFVLGGGMSNVEILYQAGYENMKSKLLVPDYAPKILKNQLGDSSGVFGAGILPISN